MFNSDPITDLEYTNTTTRDGFTVRLTITDKYERVYDGAPNHYYVVKARITDPDQGDPRTYEDQIQSWAVVWWWPFTPSSVDAFADKCIRRFIEQYKEDTEQAVARKQKEQETLTRLKQALK